MAECPSPWGWGRPQRTLLAALVAAGAVALLVAVALRGGRDASPPPPLVVDVNAAPPAVLLALPGLGPGRVDSILAARSERPFDSLDDLARRVKGVGPATIEGLRPFVRVGPSDRDGGDPPGTAPPPRGVARPPVDGG